MDAKVDLPNLEQQLKLAVDTSSVDEKPGTDPFDREQNVNVGLETYGIFLKKTQFRVGVRSSLDAYASCSWRPEMRRGPWKISPEARAYYRTDKKEGVVGSVNVTYTVKDRLRTGWLSSIEGGHHTDWRATWLQNFSFAYLFEGNEEDHHRALSSTLSIKGLWDEQAQSYRWKPISYHAPLYKKWLYWELGPEILWRESDRWEPETAVRFTVSSLFWGTGER